MKCPHCNYKPEINEYDSLLEDLRYNLSQYDDGEWYLHDGADKIIEKVDKFLENRE